MIDTLHILVRDMIDIKINNMKKYINAILTLSSVMVLFYIIYDQHKQINLYKSNGLNNTIDSLQLELFNAQTIANRYDIALDLLKEQDSAAAAKFEDVLNNETE